ncbi:MAG: hypothetical protein SGI73_14380 [Chloroflexota bacterium]|nr:hypothetical protein [Chloroflexota bacterium]
MFQQLTTLNRRIKARGTAQAMLDCLAALDPRTLSRYAEQNALGVVSASPFQVWTLNRARALYVLGRYADCLNVCQSALVGEVEWVADGEGWVHCRVATCHHKLGDTDEALCEFERLMHKRIDLRWYVPHSLSECLLEVERPLKAYLYTAQAALNRRSHERLAAKWRVFWQGARVCDALNAPNLSALHTLMAVKLLMENKRPVERDLQIRLEVIPVDVLSLSSSESLFTELRPMWDAVVAVDQRFRVDSADGD